MRRRVSAPKPAKPVAPKVNSKEIEKLFKTYADEESPDVMDMEGISRLSEALGIDPTADVRILVLMWRLGAVSKPGQVSCDEFQNGMENVGCDTIESLVELAPSLDPGFLERSTFREFYKFVFQFSREGTHRTIEKDVVVALLPMAVSNRSEHVTAFVEFLEQCSTTRITLDQWSSFLDFSDKVGVSPSFEGYEEDGAWPLLLDEYVEHWQKKNGAKK